MDKILKVQEIFTSIQGESNLQGYPCVFVRLHGCNLKCSYCDTIQGDKDFILMTAEQVYNAVKEYNIKSKYVCITGGEPLLQIENMKWLLNKLVNEDYYTVSFETNGAVEIPEWANIDGTEFVIDIKTPSSGHTVDWDIIKKNLPIIRLGDTKIKFVVSNQKDFEFALDAMNKLKSLCDDATYVSYAEEGILDSYDSDFHFYPQFIFSPVMKSSKDFNASFTFANWIARQLVWRNVNARLQLQLHKLIGVE